MKYSYVSYDWKQSGCEEEWEEALKKFGLCLNNDPMMEGSDTVGIFITKGEPTQKQLQAMVKDQWGELADE